MEKQIKVGPIQRRKNPNALEKIKMQTKKMKLGEFFEITGVDARTANAIRSSLWNFAKKDGLRVATTLSNDTLTIERVRK